MRKLFILIFFFTCTKSFEQITFQQNAKKTFDSAFNKMSIQSKKAANVILKDEFLKGSLVIANIFETDTLNKQDTDHFSTSLIILDSKSHPITSKPKELLPSLFPMVGRAYLKGDTLIINISPNLFSKLTITHKIFKDSVLTTVEQWEKYDSVYRAIKSETNTTQLTVSAKTTKFILSDRNFKIGKAIFGQADVISDDFYYLAAYNFKDSTIKSRWHFKYFFKFFINRDKSIY